ncbi:PROLINE-RICH RECEPTOR-LIKE PROTEIN KINASE PERK13-RELATED [Salix koriyanagi]|uniref:non-specific serine/threonine protein kinase n=1 Tax=Salix koriyanagi TaxID=2511006 RepID=A0A9Q0WPX4_9ROSI|nr:PROLINE-RICH RECEPTOR-LIKE PROTEIN KINASE PERK13-RELATED [Salix koriyanagi]
MPNSVGESPPGSSLNESLPLSVGTNFTTISGSSPPVPVGEESIVVNDNTSASLPPSTNGDSPPTPIPSSPPPATLKSPPPPSPLPPSPPPSNFNSSPPLSPPLVSNSTLSNSPPPLITSPPPPPPPTPAKVESPPPSVQSPPPAPAIPPPLLVNLFLHLPLEPSESNSTQSNGPNPTESRFHSPPDSGGSPSDRSSSIANAKNHNVVSNPQGNQSNGTGNKTIVTEAAAAGAGVVFMALIVAIFLFVKRSRKRRIQPFSHYIPPKNFTVQTDGYFYGQQKPSVGFAGPGSHSYQSPTALSDSCGSQTGNMYHGGGPDSGVLGGSKTFFSYHELMEITNGFARQNIIGEGGFGCVFEGRMPDGKAVAVKQLKVGSGQGEREFKAEVEIISRVHHRHLVSLVGYCISDNQRLLIYEFVPNKTLEHHLHAKDIPVLDWPKRLKIAIGSAKGLAYLHEDCHPTIIHRDIKSSNILLDDAFEAQVADFGLARLNDTAQTHVSTRVMGTFGYLAPEYASIDSSQPLGDESLVEWARPLLIHALETGEIGELVDTRLEKHYVESELFRMVETAAACVRHSAPKRPRMAQVVRALDSEGELSDLSNGVKFGQSTVYDSAQYSQDISKFRGMAIGSKGSSEFDTSSGDYSGRIISRETPTSSPALTSSESQTQAINHHGSYGRRHFR